MSPEDKAMLVESMRNDRNPNPQIPDHAVRLLEETCTRTGLDWKLRHVYLIQRGGKWQVTVSIDGFRLIANQDPEYAGQEGPFWTMGPDQSWTDIPPVKAPYASKVGVVRNKGGVTLTTWGVAKFDDYNARSPMWTKFGSTMIAKCAEMLGLRKALPGRLGGLYGVEEMDQADSGRNSKAIGRAKAAEPEQQPDAIDYEEQILDVKSTAALKELGLEIQKSQLGLKAKQELSLTYNARKAELEAEEKQ